MLHKLMMMVALSLPLSAMADSVCDGSQFSKRGARALCEARYDGSTSDCRSTGHDFTAVECIAIARKSVSACSFSDATLKGSGAEEACEAIVRHVITGASSSSGCRDRSITDPDLRAYCLARTDDRKSSCSSISSSTLRGVCTEIAEWEPPSMEAFPVETYYQIIEARKAKAYKIAEEIADAQFEVGMPIMEELMPMLEAFRIAHPGVSQDGAAAAARAADEGFGADAAKARAFQQDLDAYQAGWQEREAEIKRIWTAVTAENRRLDSLLAKAQALIGRDGVQRIRSAHSDLEEDTTDFLQRFKGS